MAGNLQGIDYTYTLQGALKSINHVNQTIEPGHDSPKSNGFYKDLFALTLDYFSGDYRSRAIDVMTPVTTGGAAVPTRYDGTIQGAAWRTRASPIIHRMAYEYDEKSQLQNSTYGKLGISGGYYHFDLDPAKKILREGGLSYDPNGNIQSLQRTDDKGAVTDNFSYSYKPNTNQLAAVHTGSASGPTALDYDYDALGQLTRQRDEQGQRYLTYDVTGKTTGIYLDADHQQPLVIYAYDDRGFRVSQTAYPVGTTAPAHTTYYVRDVAGNVLATYEQPTPAGPVQRSEVPLYGSSRLGTLTRLKDGTEDYRYELDDHLGDARVVFHRPTTTTYLATMEPAAAGQEERDFANVASTRFAAPGHGGSANVARLGITSGQQVGPRKTLTVQHGDTLTFTAYAWLTAALSVRGQDPVSALRVVPLLSLGARTPGAPATATDGGAATRPLPQVQVGVALLPGGEAPTASANATAIPGNAQLHYLVRDAQGNLVAEDYQAADPKAPAAWQPLQLGLRLAQAGTVELSVETADALHPDVFFDDLTVEQTGGLIVQEQHQYAYGAPLPGLSYTVGNRRYRHGYQGQFAEQDTLTGFESFELRLYNSRIGRWLSYDPEGQFSSPYVGMGNNPVSGVDPNGGWDWSSFCARIKEGFNHGKAVALDGFTVVGQRVAPAIERGNKHSLIGFISRILGVAGDALTAPAREAQLLKDRTLYFKLTLRDSHIKNEEFKNFMFSIDRRAAFGPHYIVGTIPGLEYFSPVGEAAAVKGFLNAAETETGALKLEQAAFEHGYEYHPRIRARGIQDPTAHNFPYSFDDEILTATPTVRPDGSLYYQYPGTLNGKAATYEISLNPQTKTIFHRNVTTKK